MSPELHLKVTYFLYLFCHLLIQLLELLHVSKLSVNISILLGISLDLKLYHVLVPV